MVGVDDANISWLVLWHSVFHLAALAPPPQPLQEHYIKLYDHIFHGDKPALEIARRSHLAKAAIQLGIAVERKVGETRREVPSVILCVFWATTAQMQNNSSCTAMHLSTWRPHWSVLLHMATFSSFEFPFLFRKSFQSSDCSVVRYYVFPGIPLVMILCGRKRPFWPVCHVILCRQYAERDSGSLESFWGLKVAQFWELTSALKGQHVWFQSSNKFDYVCKEEPKVMPWGLIQLMQSRCVLNVLMMEHYIRIWKATWVWVRGFQWTYSAYENVGKIYRFCFYQAHSIWVGLDALSLLPPPKH